MSEIKIFDIPEGMPKRTCNCGRPAEVLLVVNVPGGDMAQVCKPCVEEALQDDGAAEASP